MKFRCVFLGLFLSAVMCACCYFHDTVIRSGSMTIANLFPPVAYGGLILFLLFINPLLRLAGKKAPLTRGEIAVALGLFLIACGIPGWSFGEMFTGTVMYPHHDNRTIPAWNACNVLELAPPNALCDLSGPQGEEIALNGFITGLGSGDNLIALSDVPWQAWKAPLLFWGPLVLSFLLAIFGLAVVFHKQWSDHEQLPYPIAQFATSLLPTPQGKLSPMFLNRLFWVGFGVSFLLLMNNFCCRIWPNVFIPVQLSFNLSPFGELCPTVLHGKGHILFMPRIIIATVGLAYFLPSDASFSMWVGPWIYCLIGGIFAAYGTDLRAGKMMALVPEPFIFAGGYFGIFMVIFYTGRQFYWHTFKRALGLRNQEDIPSYAVQGMRLFLVCFLIFVVTLHLVGVHWTVGLPYALLAIMVYTVISRVLAETGAYEVGTFVYPCVFLWGVFGATALGPKVLIILFMLSTVLLAGPGWCVMPFINHALKITEHTEAKVSRTARWGVLSMLIAIAVSIPATIYWQYTQGAPTTGWPRSSAQYPFANAVEIIHTLKAQGLETVASSHQGFDHILNLNPDWTLIAAFAITALLAIGAALGRLKYTWWPLHPVIFIFLGGYQGMLLSASFGLGFLLKKTVTKYGGGALYQHCKPLFFGLIAGQMTDLFIQMIIGIAFYIVTGTAL